MKLFRTLAERELSSFCWNLPPAIRQYFRGGFGLKDGFLHKFVVVVELILDDM
jgi:hypothetical protein